MAIRVIKTGSIDIWNDYIRKVLLGRHLLETNACALKVLNAALIWLFFSATASDFDGHVLDVVIHIWNLLFVLEDGLCYLARRADLQCFLFPFKIIYISRFKKGLPEILFVQLQPHWVTGRCRLNWLMKVFDRLLGCLLKVCVSFTYLTVFLNLWKRWGRLRKIFIAVLADLRWVSLSNLMWSDVREH